MNYEEFKSRVLKNLEVYKRDVLLCNDNGIENGRKCSYMLPENRYILNLLPTVKSPEKEFRYYKYAYKLNSSQMMCYNFFKPLLDEEEGRKILLKIIRNCFHINTSSNTSLDMFHWPEMQRYDCYIKLSTGEKIYLETRYTEKGFEKENFLSDTFSRIKSFKDYVVLIFCFDNPIVREEAQKIIEVSKVKGCKNVMMADWKELCRCALEYTENTRYNRHFYEFDEKYLKY